MADKSIPQRLQEELTNLQSVVDEVKLQMHLGSKEIQDKLQPHLEELEKSETATAQDVGNGRKLSTGNQREETYCDL